MENNNSKSTEVIIETSRGCRSKYAYDKKLKAFKLKKIMPAGVVFPFDFGLFLIQLKTTG